MSDVDRVRSLLRQAGEAGVVTADQADAIGAAFVDRHGATEIRAHLLTDDERDALDRVCVWLEWARVPAK